MASLQVGMGGVASLIQQKPVWRMPGAWEAGRLGGTHLLGTTAKPLPSPQTKHKKQGTLSFICDHRNTNSSSSSFHIARPNAHGTFALKDHFPMLMIPINKDEEEEEEEEEKGEEEEEEEEEQEEEEEGKVDRRLDEDEETEWRLYSLPGKRLLDFKIPIPTFIYTNYCCGSTQYGWLVFVDDSCAVRLLNPFSSQEIQLPPLTTFPYPRLVDSEEIEWVFDPRKTALSSNPSSTSDFHVLAFFGSEHVGFYRSGGDKVWTLLEHPDGRALWRLRFYEDVIFYNQKFHVVDKDGKVMSCDTRDPHPSLTIVASPPSRRDVDRRYLVELSGDLLQVERISGPFESGVSYVSCMTRCFRVYKLDLTKGKWKKVKSLGDRSLFLGNNTSCSISASDFPGCKPNCIYFTDNTDNPNVMDDWNVCSIGGAHDFGIFNLEDGSIEPLPFPRDSLLVIPPPVWVLPAETLE